MENSDVKKNSRESQNIEFKTSWHDDYLKWICGFANACYSGGYIDTWGRGTLKIINSCREAGLPEPEMKEMNGGVSMTLFAHPESEKTSSEKVGEKITDNQRIILEILSRNTYASAKSLSDSVGI